VPTLQQRLVGLESTVAGSGSYNDLGLAVIREQTGEPLLVTGGRWERTRRRFLDLEEGDAETYIELHSAESQVDFLTWYAEWLCAYREGYPRETQLVMLADDRRGGKTMAGNIAIASGINDVPRSPKTGRPTLAAIVAKSYRERFEIEDWLLNAIPSGPRGFYRHVAAPEHQFIWHSGAVLRLLSADDPDSIKQGRFDLVFFNEPQKMAARAVANGVMATADLGGLAILAANPPGKGDRHGGWLFDLKEALDDELVAKARGQKVEALGIKHFFCPSSKNQFIDQAARRKAGRIAVIIDPTIAAGDERGEWERKKENAAWEFNRHRHLHALPEVSALPDITGEICSDRGEYGDWLYVAGIDFDWRPHIASVVYKVFGELDDPLFWACDEFIGEKLWTTAQWIEAFAERGVSRGYSPKNLLFIGDASSSYPVRERDPKTDGRTSFEVLEEAGWIVIPPQDHRGRGKEGRARNPFVGDRLDLYNEHLRRDRVMIDSRRAPWFAECNRRATTKKEGPRMRLVHDQFAHAMDAGTYPVWRLAPKAGISRPTADDIVRVRPRRPKTW